MRLLRTGAPGQERPAVLADDGRLLDLTPLTPDIDPAFLAGDGVARARDAVEAGRLPTLLPLGKERVGPPVTRPAAIVCIGQNYAAHAAESGDAPPRTPIVFFKHPNTLVGPHDAVRVPPGASKVDWEVELAVVIGRRARYLDSPDLAAAHIAGFAISNDVSERDFQLAESGGQWSKGKCCETFNPLGPWLVTPDEAGDAQALRLRLWVNGEPRQDSTTADMIFDVAYLVWHLSQYLVLEPGDIVNTGTPQGVALSGRFPYLTDGDLVELEIDRLGRQAQRIEAASVPAYGGT